MTGNPYTKAWARARANRRRVEPWAMPARVAIGIATTAALIPLFRPVFLGFLDGAPEHVADGALGLFQRVVIAIIALLTLDVYTALVRGPDRAVVEILPVDGAAISAAGVWQVARDRLWLVPLAAALTAPLALEVSVALWALGVLVAAGAFALGLAASAVVHLLAIDAATSERWAPLLDALRGHNPREQAAFIYAPGVGLAAAGSIALAGAQGARLAYDGDAVGYALLAAPFVAAVAFAAQIPALARRTWAKASPVLADIDARYAAIERPEDARRVFLDWSVRFLPHDIARYALKDLRHGWRARRAWITGAWIAGLLAAMTGWSADPAAPARSAAAVGVAVFGIAAIGVVLDRDEPAFLRVWLPDGGASRRAGRLFALIAWLQGCVWPALAAQAIRHGVGGVAIVAEVALIAVIGAATAAIACGALRERGVFAYVPIAAVAATSLGAIVAGGPP